jgi:cell division protein FtsB
LRAQADGIEAVQRREAQAARRRLRIGFQVVILAVVGLLVFTLVFPTLRLYMAQQVVKEQLRAEVEAAAAKNEDLVAQLKRWEDPAFVKAQARQRLSFAMPGDRSFRVSDPQNAPSTVPSVPEVREPTHLSDPLEPAQASPWYAELWNSVVVAGNVGDG